MFINIGISVYNLNSKKKQIQKKTALPSYVTAK